MSGKMWYVCIAIYFIIIDEKGKYFHANYQYSETSLIDCGESLS